MEHAPRYQEASDAGREHGLSDGRIEYVPERELGKDYQRAQVRSLGSQHFQIGVEGACDAAELGVCAHDFLQRGQGVCSFCSGACEEAIPIASDEAAKRCAAI